MRLRPGDSIDRYEVVSKIGSGGMATVYHVRLAAKGGFERHLALKMLHPHLCDDREFVELFLHEARVVSSIHHRNVVQIYDVGTYEGIPFMIMELLQGSPLGRIMKRSRQGDVEVPIGFWLQVLSQAAEGLDAVHRAVGPGGEQLNIVHRDVVPANIYICADGLVKVVDFGIAEAHDRTTRTQTGQLRGTLPYVAPERIDGSREVDARVDVWSLGVIGWECITKRKLFEASDDAQTLWNVVSMEIPSLDDLRPDLAEPVRSKVMACLERNPRARPSSAGDIAQTFATTARSLGVASPSEIALEMKQLFANGIETAPPVLHDLVLGDVESQRALTATTERVGAPPNLAKNRRWVGLVLAGFFAMVLFSVVAFILGGFLERDEPRAGPSPSSPASVTLEPLPKRGDSRRNDGGGVETLEPVEQHETFGHPLDDSDETEVTHQPHKRRLKRPYRNREKNQGSSSSPAHDKRLIRELSPER